MLLLQLETLCAFTNATPSSRNMIEGQKVVNPGMIIMCGASSRSRTSIELYAICLQTSALTSDPHVIKGFLNIVNISNNPDADAEFVVQIKEMTCSCKAGTSQCCKHIVAVLLYCNRQDLNSLQLLSSTDKKCLWKKHKAPVLEQFAAEPIKKFCCIQQDRLPTLADTIQESICHRLTNCNADTALAKHRYRNSTSPFENKNLNIKKTAIATKNCTTKWKKERKFRITGSRCYSLFTYSKDDWPGKACKYFLAKEFTNKFVQHGLKYESVARNKYCIATNLLVEQCGLIVSMTEPWLAYSPDGVTIKDSKPHKLLEVKCPFELESTSNEVLLKKCKFIKEQNNDITIKTKHQYYAQVQFGIALLNLKNCDFVIYSSISNTIKIISIAYNKEFVENLFTELKRIYFEKMLHEICKNLRST